ncbi:GNAT family N-acetyltransferase [Leptospira sp. WS92.C1]
MDIKILNKTDLEWVLFIEDLCFGSRAWSREMLISHLGEFLGVGIKDLGYVLYKLAGDEIEIYRIAIHPIHQRQSKAKRLLEFLLNRERDKTFFLEVSSHNESAIGLYEACGFQKIHVRKHYYEDGSDALIYKKPPMDVLENFSFDIPS